MIDHLDQVEAYLRECESNGFSPETLRNMRPFYKWFLRKCEELSFDIANLSMADLSLIRDQFAQNVIKSQKKKIGYIGNYLDYLEDMDFEVQNKVPRFKKKRLGKRASKTPSLTRSPPSVDEVRDLINHVFKSRDRAFVVLLAKTGMRLGEVISLNVDDLDLDSGWVQIDPLRFNKRTNCRLPIDEETIEVLKKWLSTRSRYPTGDENALFLNRSGSRWVKATAGRAFRNYSKEAGLWRADDPWGKRVTPHHMRHFFTTQLIERGMPREMVQHLRGDKDSAAVDTYTHISEDNLKREYLNRIPRLVV